MRWLAICANFLVGSTLWLSTGCIFSSSSSDGQDTIASNDHILLQGTVPPVPVAEVSSSIPNPPAPPSDYGVKEPAPLVMTTSSRGLGAENASVEVRPATERKAMAREVTDPIVPPPPPREDPLVTALRHALEKHPEEARRLLDKYNKTDRELLLSLLRLTAGLSEGTKENLSGEDVSQSLEQLNKLVSALRDRAPLTLEKVCFCKRIEGFGRFTAQPADYAFEAGSDGRPGERVKVYAQVRNFSSKLVEGRYETTLESKLEIRDAERRTVVSLDLGRCIDRSQSPRQDYFLNFQLHVPAKLTPGLYTLWVTVKDVTTNQPREASLSLDFRVRAPGAAQTSTASRQD